MADTISRLAVHLGLDTTKLRTGVGEATSILSGMGAKLTGAFAAVTGGLTAGGIAGFGVKLAAEAEQSRVAFEVMIGSAREAQNVLAEIRQFAVATPFEFPELRDASRSLIAFGIGAGDVVTHLRRIGDVSSGIGAPIGEIAELYGKARVQGRLFAEDINQLTGRGIPIISELAKQFGVAESEVRKLVQSGAVNFSHLEKAFESMTSTGGKFAGLMQRQSETLIGRWSTLSDTAKEAAMNFGNAVAPALSKLVMAATPLAQALSAVKAETIQNIIKVGAFTVTLGGTLAILPRMVQGISSIVGALRTMASTQAIVTALQGPKGWANLAASLAVAAGAALTLDYAFKEIDKSAGKASGSMGQVGKEADKLTGSIADAVQTSMAQIAGSVKSSAAAMEGDIGAARSGMEQAAKQLEGAQTKARLAVSGLQNAKQKGVVSDIKEAQDRLTKAREGVEQAQAGIEKAKETMAAAQRARRDKYADAGMDGFRLQQEKLMELQREGERLKEQFATPSEQFAAERQRLSKLLAAGAIGQETFSRAMEAANEKLRQHARDARDAADARRRLNDIAAPQALLRGTTAAQSAVTNFQFNNPQGNALLQQILDAIRRAPVIGAANI